MPVFVRFKRVGTFNKLRDKTTEPGGLPNKLNELRTFYGKLENPLDLNLGCEEFQDEGMGDVFQSTFDFVKKVSERGTPLVNVIKADFFSNRKILTLLATSAYNPVKAEIIALRKNGVIFLYKNEEDYAGNGIGYNFEKYMTLNENGELRNPNEKVSNAEYSKVVLRTSFHIKKEKLKVYYAADVDAINSKKQFVELKTTGLNKPKWLERNSLGAYFQCFLGTVPCIIIGQRTLGNYVHRVDKYWTNKIPEMDVKWDPNVCLEKLFNVLSTIKSKLQYDDEAISVKLNGQHIFYESTNAGDWNFVDPSFLEYFE